MRTTCAPWICATPVSLAFVMLLGSIFICKNGGFRTWLWLPASARVKFYITLVGGNKYRQKTSLIYSLSLLEWGALCTRSRLETSPLGDILYLTSDKENKQALPQGYSCPASLFNFWLRYTIYYFLNQGLLRNKQFVSHGSGYLRKIWKALHLPTLFKLRRNIKMTVSSTRALIPCPQ